MARRRKLRSVSAFTGPPFASNMPRSLGVSRLRSIGRVGEESGVVMGVRREAVADSELAVAEPDGRLEAGDPRFRVEEKQARLADVPDRPSFGPAAEIDLAVRQGAGTGESELPEGVCLALGAAKTVDDADRHLGVRHPGRRESVRDLLDASRDDRLGVVDQLDNVQLPDGGRLKRHHNA